VPEHRKTRPASQASRCMLGPHRRCSSCVWAIHSTARLLTHASVLTRRQTGKSSHGTVVHITLGNLIMLC
jgi:hypothetical protein